MAMKKRIRTRKIQESKVLPAKRESPPKGNGLMRPDTGALTMPSDLNDEDKSRSILPNRVVMVITILALLFITVITWFVAHMPPKT
jgi:hypothetical protein